MVYYRYNDLIKCHYMCDVNNHYCLHLSYDNMKQSDVRYLLNISFFNASFNSDDFTSKFYAQAKPIKYANSINITINTYMYMYKKMYN